MLIFLCAPRGLYLSLKDLSLPPVVWFVACLYLFVGLLVGLCPRGAYGSGTEASAALGMASQAIGVGGNFMAARTYQATCYSPSKTGCPEMALSYANAASDALSALQSLATKNAAHNGGGGVGSIDLPDLSSFDTLSDMGDYFAKHPESFDQLKTELPPEVKDAFGNPKDLIGHIQGVTDKGFDVDLKTQEITLPEAYASGSSSVSGTGSVKVSGKGFKPEALPPHVAKDIQSRVAKALGGLKKNKPAMGAGGGFNYGGSSSYKASSYKPSSFTIKPFQFPGAAEQRKPASVKGLQRVVASGESIGVAGDNVFGMITRRYQKMSTQGTFINK